MPLNRSQIGMLNNIIPHLIPMPHKHKLFYNQVKTLHRILSGRIEPKENTTFHTLKKIFINPTNYLYHIENLNPQITIHEVQKAILDCIHKSLYKQAGLLKINKFNWRSREILKNTFADRNLFTSSPVPYEYWNIPTGSDSEPSDDDFNENYIAPEGALYTFDYILNEPNNPGTDNWEVFLTILLTLNDTEEYITSSLPLNDYSITEEPDLTHPFLRERMITHARERVFEKVYEELMSYFDNLPALQDITTERKILFTTKVYYEALKDNIIELDDLLAIPHEQIRRLTSEKVIALLERKPDHFEFIKKFNENEFNLINHLYYFNLMLQNELSLEAIIGITSEEVRNLMLPLVMQLLARPNHIIEWADAKTLSENTHTLLANPFYLNALEEGNILFKQIKNITQAELKVLLHEETIAQLAASPAMKDDISLLLTKTSQEPSPKKEKRVMLLIPHTVFGGREAFNAMSRQALHIVLPGDAIDRDASDDEPYLRHRSLSPTRP